MLILARKFATFPTVDSMNLTIRKFKEIAKGLVPKSVMATIDFLSQHSCKVKGVSFPTYEYMADKTGLSIATLKRAIKKLQQLGVIQVIHVWAGGRQRSNIYQIQPNVDWNHLISTLMGNVRIEWADNPSEGGNTTTEPIGDIANDQVEDTKNDTLSTAHKPLVHKRSWRIPAWGSSYQAFTNSKNIYESNREPYPFVGYNWLEPNRN